MSRFTFTEPGDSDFPECPIGMWPARCIDIVDHGEEPTQYGPKLKISFVFQVAAGDGATYFLRKKMPFNAKLHKNSMMGQTLKSWLGAKPNPGEGIEDLYQLGAQVNVSHDPKDDGDGVWVNIEHVLPAGGMAMPKMDLTSYNIPDGSTERMGVSIIHSP